jgi:lipoyl(octanoyl) transferase
MIQILYLGRVGYSEALALQEETAALVGQGRLQNTLLLLEHPPVLTLGRNASRVNILASNELLKRRGVTIHEINRGGDVTYHGPGQLVGYPIFDLRTLKNPNGPRMGPVDFVRGMEEALIRVCLTYGVRAGRVVGLTGVWCGEAGTREKGLGTSGSENEELGTGVVPSGRERKIAAIGIHVARGITSHGFAFNLTTDLRDFNLIVPCGIPDHPVTSLEVERAKLGVSGSGLPDAELPTLEALAYEAARQFGIVFDEQVLAVESLEALRCQASAPAVEFPAEDTPLQIPEEVVRLRAIQNQPDADRAGQSRPSKNPTTWA